MGKQALNSGVITGKRATLMRSGPIDAGSTGLSVHAHMTPGQVNMWASMPACLCMHPCESGPK